MDSTLNILKALADKNRLRIVLALVRNGEMCACQITELLQVAGATASRHLSLLTNAGLVETRKEGRWIYYRIIPDFYHHHQELFKWLQNQVQHSPDVEADRQTLEKIFTRTPTEICRQQRGERCCPVNQTKKR